MLSKKSIPLLVAILIILLLEFIFFKPTAWKTFLTPLFLLLLIFCFSLFLLRNRIKKFWPLISQTLLLNLSGVMFFLFLENIFLRHFLIFGLAGLNWFLFENIYRLFYQPRLYQPFTMEKISLWLNFLIIFWFFGGFNILNIFLDLNFLPAALIVFAINCWLVYYFFWLNKLWQTSNFIDLIIIGLILTEFYFVLLYLPTQFYFNSLILGFLHIIIVKICHVEKLKSTKII